MESTRYKLGTPATGTLVQYSKITEVMRDQLLAEDPDCPVFGVNLACSYPFPDSVEVGYAELVHRAAKLMPYVYVYPIWQTHITIMTLINFTLSKRPRSARVRRLKSLADRLIVTLEQLFSTNGHAWNHPFTLQFERPVLTKAAAILPILNPTGEIQALRSAAVEYIMKDGALYQEVADLGLKVPPIIHSTFMRFVAVPHDLTAFAAAFEEIAMHSQLGEIQVEEILVTSETSPYMRSGEILHRFALTRSMPQGGQHQ